MFYILAMFSTQLVTVTTPGPAALESWTCHKGVSFSRDLLLPPQIPPEATGKLRGRRRTGVTVPAPLPPQALWQIVTSLTVGGAFLTSSRKGVRTARVTQRDF